PAYEGWADMTAGERARVVLGIPQAQAALRPPVLDTPGQAELQAQRQLVEDLRAERDRLARDTNQGPLQDLFGILSSRAQQQFREADRRLVEEERRVAEHEWQAAQAAAATATARQDAEVATDEQADATDNLADSNRALNRTVTERPRDPIIDEASSIQRDLQRLKLAYDQDLISREWYEEQLEAHLRRLDGLREKSSSPEQATAVLRARKGFVDELARLDPARADAAAKAAEEAEAALQKIVDAHNQYTDSLRALREAEAAEQAERDARRREHAQRKIIAAHREYTDSLKAARDLEAEAAARAEAREARREERRLQVIAEAHRQYTDSLKEAIYLQEELEERIAARGARREAREPQERKSGR